MAVPTLRLVAALIGLGILGAGSAHAATASALQLTGKGDQVYTCQASPAGFAWSLKAPDAVLTDDTGVVVGRHFAGPSWQAADGSTIVGEPLVSSPSPEPGAVAWLVLRVKSSSGAGRLDAVAYVTRTATHGGAAPATGCDAGHLGAEAREPYSATYSFFSTAPSR